MKIHEYTPTGKKLRTLGADEVLKMAKRGDGRAVREITKTRWAGAVSVDDKLNVLAQALGILDL